MIKSTEFSGIELVVNISSLYIEIFFDSKYKVFLFFCQFYNWF